VNTPRVGVPAGGRPSKERRRVEFIRAHAAALGRLLLCLALSAAATSARAAVENGSFDEGLDGWRVEGAGRVAVEGPTSGCEDGHCLCVDAPGGRWLGLSRPLAAAPAGRAVGFSLRAHAAEGQLVRVGLRDADWKNAQCAPRPLRVFVEARGAAQWQTLRGRFVWPARDECGSTDDHRWRIFVEVLVEANRAMPILIDRVSLESASGDAAGLALRCGWFDDKTTVETCPGAEPHEGLVTLAKWSLADGGGRLLREAVAGRSGVFEGGAPHWKEGVLSFRQRGDRVRVDAGQGVGGPRFEIALELRPSPGFEAGCLLASQPEGGTRDGFRLCLNQAERWLRFEFGDRGRVHRYTATFSRPLPSDVYSRLSVRLEEGELTMRSNTQTLRRFSAAGLSLRKGPHPLVVGGAMERERAGFEGEIRNLTLRAPRADPGPRRVGRIGYVTRGHWRLEASEGGIVTDSVAGHHGVVQDPAKRTPPEWREGRVRFAGRPDAGGITIRNAGPIYGDDFRVAFDAWLDAPANDWGTLLASKTGGSVWGGLIVDYLGSRDQLVVKLADGTRQTVSHATLPFDLPAGEWIPIEVVLRHGELVVNVAQVEVGRFPHPDFELAVARDALILGSYYYPPSKGVRGSLRDVVLEMREGSLAENEAELLRPAPPAPSDERAPCALETSEERWLVGRNVVVPNWIPTRCLAKRDRDRRFDFVVDVPEGFELVGSGASVVERGQIQKNPVRSGRRVEHAGQRYRRYRVVVSYRLVAGHTAGYGPLYLRAKEDAPTRATLRVQRVDDEDATPRPEGFSEWEVEARDFPLPGRPAKLHHSLAWMQLHSSSTWPDFFDHYAALGFNVVPMLTLYDEVVSERVRRRFVKRARKRGFELLALDSPYHRLIAHPDARTRTRDGVRQPYIDPSYRGAHYRDEVARVTRQVAAIEPDWFMMDIECFNEGAYACLIGAAPECTRYLEATARDPAADRASWLTDLGTELVANIRDALRDELGDAPLPRMGTNTSEPGSIYHHLFDFEKLYGEAVDYAQPILYRERPGRMGERVRAIRAAMPRGDIIAWMDPGSVVEYPSPQIYDRMLEVFGAGARGLAWFAFENFEGEDLYFVASAIDAVLPVEGLILQGAPSPPLEVVAGDVEASGLLASDAHLLMVVRDDAVATPREVELTLPDGVRGALWELASKRRIATVDAAGRVRFGWRPGAEGAHTALYYVGPAPFENGRFATEASRTHAAGD